MNYYKRHLGDYAAATRHLSLLEHGVYCMLLDLYYSAERPLPADAHAVHRLVGAKGKDERAAVDTILGEFFKQCEDGWRHARCDQEIRLKQAQAKLNQGLGALGGRPKAITVSVIPENRNGFKPRTETVSGAETETVSGAETEPNPSHKPLATNHYLDTPDGVSAAGEPAVADCPHQALIALYGQHLPELPQPKPELWFGKNAQALRARWKWVLTAKRSAAGERYATNETEALDWFARFFRHVARSDFLTGRNGKWGGCDLGWLVKADNFAKVVQGNYDNEVGA